MYNNFLLHFQEVNWTNALWMRGLESLRWSYARGELAGSQVLWIKAQCFTHMEGLCPSTFYTCQSRHTIGLQRPYFRGMVVSQGVWRRGWQEGVGGVWKPWQFGDRELWKAEPGSSPSLYPQVAGCLEDPRRYRPKRKGLERSESCLRWWKRAFSF